MSSPLHKAISSDDLPSFFKEVDKLSDPSDALVVTVLSGKIPWVLRLLERGVDINTKRHSVLTPLTAAVKSQDETMINLLINHGADLNLPDSDGRYPLHYACKSSYLARFLLSRGADPDAANVLHYAIDVNPEIVPVLLAYHTSFDLIDELGNTPLMTACELHKYPVVSALMNHSDVDLQNPYTGQTALHIAIELDFFPAILLLLTKKPSLDLVDNEGRTVLHTAIRNLNEPVVEMLLKHGADPTIPDEEGLSCLSYAIMEESIPMILSILERVQAVTIEEINLAREVFPECIRVLLQYL